MTALNTKMPVGYPTKDDFHPDDLRDGTFSEHWKYGAGYKHKSKNYGGSYRIKDDHVIVAYSYHEHSGTNVRRQYIGLIEEKDGLFSIPNGIHLESNLNPDEHPGGDGASHKWTVSYTYVPVKKWKAKAFEIMSKEFAV